MILDFQFFVPKTSSEMARENLRSHGNDKGGGSNDLRPQKGDTEAEGTPWMEGIEADRSDLSSSHQSFGSF